MNWKPSKVFYGWWIVAASFLTGLYVAGVVFYGFTAIFEPIAAELGWSYTQVSLASSLRGLETGLLAPLIGVLADRWGPRRLIVSGAIFSAAGLILLGRTTSLATFYAAFLLTAVGLSCCTMTVLMTAVANWFQRRMGLAIGITTSSFGFAGLLVPVIVWLTDLYEWRTAITILALGMLIIVLPLSLVFRHKPEQYGHLPDGQEDTAADSNRLSQPQAVKADVKAKQAFKTRAFWCISLAFMCHHMIISAVITHVMPYLSSIGIVRSMSSLVATAIPLLSISGRLGLGWLGDKIKRRLVAAVAFAMIGFGLLCFGYVSSEESWLLVPFLFLLGTSYGGPIALRPSLLREHFGRTSFGTILGLTIGISQLGAIAGPPLAGWVFDNWGSYQGIWLIFAGLSVVAMMLMLAIPPVRTTTQTQMSNES
ncbi:MFS transporter [Chloroflexota bacterium]